MGILRKTIMKFGFAFIGSAFAQNLTCYDCVGNPAEADSCKKVDDKTPTVPCESQCFTMQYNDLKVDGVAGTFYLRGCNPNPNAVNFDNGCITTTQGGNACYQGCSGIGDKPCNGHDDLTYHEEANSTGTASISFLATILYILS